MYDKLLSIIYKYYIVSKIQFCLRITILRTRLYCLKMRHNLDKSAISISLIPGMHMIQLLIIPYQENCIVVASDERHWNGSKITCQIDIELLNIIDMTGKIVEYCVESHNGLYYALVYFWLIWMGIYGF